MLTPPIATLKRDTKAGSKQDKVILPNKVWLTLRESVS